MYNYLVERMYQEYETVTDHVTDQNIINFVSNGKVVGILYRKEQVLNIFLSASPSVVWNLNGLALFVVAKKYAVFNNSKMRKTEAAWLIGCWGAQLQYTLSDPMYLKSELYLFFSDLQPSGMACVNKGNGCVKFKLFDMEIEYRKSDERYIAKLNPALVYPVKRGGKKVKNAKSYFGKIYDWEYRYDDIREFIDTKANKTNHTKFSEIRYNIIRK